MGRWTQYDDDDYRLPSNVVRTGYDADEGRYYFKDQSNGKIYRGLEGQEFGDLEYVEGGEGDDETGQVEPEPTTIRDEAERVRRYAEDGPGEWISLLLCDPRQGSCPLILSATAQLPHTLMQLPLKSYWEMSTTPSFLK